MGGGGVALAHHVLTHLFGQETFNEVGVVSLVHGSCALLPSGWCPVPLKSLVDQGKLLTGRGGGC